MVPWPPLLLLLASSAAARPTEASNDMKARFAAHLTRLRQRHAGGARQAAADAQFVRRFYKKKPVRTKQPKPTPRPKYFSPRAKDANILLLMVEDLRRDHVVGDKARTPHIDALAARNDAVSFDRAFAQATWCAPSRASLLTGLEPYQNAAGEKVKKAETFAKRLKLAGYETVRVGKIAHTAVPRALVKQDRVARPAYAATTDIWTRRHHARGAEDFSRGVFECLATQNRSDPRNFRPKPTKRAHLRLCKEFTTVSLKPGAAPQADETIAQTAVAELGRLYNSSDPFLLAVGFVRPHYPYVLPANLAARVHGGPDPGLLSPIDECGAAPLWRDTSVLRLEASVDDPKYTAAAGARAYAAAVEYVDERAGVVLEAVDWQRTTVIFTSDHGVFLGEHHLWEKLSLQEQVTRVPLIVAGRAVDKHKGPRRVSAPVELLDLYPTILGIAGVTPALKRTGRRLPHVRGAKRRKNGLAVWNDNARHLKPDSRRVAVSWKYAWRFEHTGLLVALPSATYVLTTTFRNATPAWSNATAEVFELGQLHESLYGENPVVNLAAVCNGGADASAGRRALCSVARGLRSGLPPVLRPAFAEICEKRWGIANRQKKPRRAHDVHDAL